MKDLKRYEALINALPEYEAWKYIAEGGAGTVFETVHRPTGQKRAIKWYVTKEHALRRNMITASEIGKDATLQTAKRIFNHPNLVQIYETAFVNIDRAEYLDEITKRDAEYVTMEFVRGKPISKIPRECFTLTEIQEVMNGAIAGVGHIHKQGFVHGDPTDNNILVPDSKIIDYDLLVPINTKIDINNLAASFDFLAPDHMIHLLYTPKIDVYTLAFVLNKLLTGQTPLERSAKIKGIMSMYLAIDAIRPFIKGEEPLTFIQDETFAEPEKLNSMLRDATCHYLEDRLTLDEFHARMNEAIEAEIHSRKKFVRNWTVPT